MHFHLPKPLHGWREFAGEVGIIVIGVLIALSAEQLVERWHSDRQAEQARAALRAEIGDDDLPQAYVRLAIAPCLDGQLKRLQSAVDNHMPREHFAVLARAYLPPARTWDNQAWDAVVATGDLSHGGSGELLQWSLPYRVITVLGPRNTAETEDRENLRSISTAPGQLTPAEQDRVIVALEHLRRDEAGMVNASNVLISAAQQAGVAMSEPQKRKTLDEVRPSWGKCMRTPTAERIDVNTQNDRQFRD
jgi:hypothetical protein